MLELYRSQVHLSRRKKMKNVIVAGVAALALVGCGSSEEVVAPEAAPVVEEAPVDPAPGDLVVGTNENGAPVVNGGPASVDPAAAPVTEAPAAQ